VLHILLVVLGIGLVCFVLAFLLDWFDGSDLTPPP
jgi:phosphatidylglycerophosphate synthase